LKVGHASTPSRLTSKGSPGIGLQQPDERSQGS
jgi:hypothetical protein